MFIYQQFVDAEPAFCAIKQNFIDFPSSELFQLTVSNGGLRLKMVIYFYKESYLHV